MEFRLEPFADLYVYNYVLFLFWSVSPRAPFFLVKLVWCLLLQTVCDAKCALEFLPFKKQCDQLISVQNSESQMVAFDALETTCQSLTQDEVLTAIGNAHCPVRP